MLLLVKHFADDLQDSADIVRIGEREMNIELDTFWQSWMFADINLDNRIDSLKKAEQFHDSIKIEIDQFFVDLKQSCKDFEMEVDSTYFYRTGVEHLKLRSDSLSIEEFLPKQ